MGRNVLWHEKTKRLNGSWERRVWKKIRGVRWLLATMWDQIESVKQTQPIAYIKWSWLRVLLVAWKGSIYLIVVQFIKWNSKNHLVTPLFYKIILFLHKFCTFSECRTSIYTAQTVTLTNNETIIRCYCSANLVASFSDDTIATAC